MIIRRVVVALDSSASMPAMDAAARIARAFDSELLGLFVENTDLLNLAALPMAGEVCYPSAARRTLDVAAMERALRAQASRLRRELSARLTDAAVKWTLEVVRGRVTGQLHATFDERDVLVAAMQPAPPRERRPPAAATREWRRRRPVSVVVPGGSSPEDVAAIAAAFIPDRGATMLLVLVGASPSAAEAWLAGSRRLLALRGIRCRTAAPASTEPAALAAIVDDDVPLVMAMAADPAQRGALVDALARL
jgi:hypothetical protein